MKEKSLFAITFLSIIIGISGAGFGIYATWQVLSIPSESEHVVVGLWGDLNRDLENPDFNEDWLWLLEINETQIYNEDYLVVNQTINHTDTRFHFIKSGLYSVHINIIWGGLDISTEYRLLVYKDGAGPAILTPAIAYHQDIIYTVDIVFYLSSDGTNFYEFACWCPTNDLFTPNSGHLAISFIGNY
jgi:hypothetical protein